MNSTSASDSLAKLSIIDSSQGSNRTIVRDKKDKGKTRAQKDSVNGDQNHTSKSNPSRSVKLRGMEKDSPEVRISKTLSWLLRHGAQGEGLAMRKDGYVKIVDLLEHPKLKAQDIDLEKVKAMVKVDSKQRYDLILESTDGKKLVSYGDESSLALRSQSTEEGTTNSTNHQAEVTTSESGIWWIKARQGHSIKSVQLELKPVNTVADIPTGMAVHGTNRAAWEIISRHGLSKMKRNHIHLAQNIAGQNVVSGMRTSSPILIYIDISKALDAGIKFWLSDNGVVLTEGDERGFLPKKFFSRVVDVKDGEVKDWEEL